MSKAHRFPRTAGAAVLTACLTAASIGRAACPNPCKITAEPATVEPPLGCGSVSAPAVSCDCGVVVQVVVNPSCPGSIKAVDFEFRACSDWRGDPEPCAVLEPGFRGDAFLPIGTTGPTHASLVIRDSDGDHRIDVDANVTEFITGGCGCVSASHPLQPPAIPAALVLGLGLVASRRRRRLKWPGADCGCHQYSATHW